MRGRFDNQRRKKMAKWASYCFPPKTRMQTGKDSASWRGPLHSHRSGYCIANPFVWKWNISLFLLLPTTLSSLRSPFLFFACCSSPFHSLIFLSCRHRPTVLLRMANRAWRPKEDKISLQINPINRFHPLLTVIFKSLSLFRTLLQQSWQLRF